MSRAAVVAAGLLTLAGFFRPSAGSTLLPSALLISCLGVCFLGLTLFFFNDKILVLRQLTTMKRKSNNPLVRAGELWNGLIGWAVIILFCLAVYHILKA